MVAVIQILLEKNPVIVEAMQTIWEKSDNGWCNINMFGQIFQR